MDNTRNKPHEKMNYNDISSIDLVNSNSVMNSKNASDQCNQTLEKVFVNQPCEDQQTLLENKLRTVSQSYEREKLLRVRLNQERDVLYNHLVYIMTYLADEDSSFKSYMKVRDKMNHVFKFGLNAINQHCLKKDHVTDADEDHNIEDKANFINASTTKNLTLTSTNYDGQKTDLEKNQKFQINSNRWRQEVSKLDRPPTILGKVPILKDVPIRMLMGPEYVQRSSNYISYKNHKLSNRNRYNFVNIAKAFGISYESMTDDQRLAFRNAICQRYSREYKRQDKLHQINCFNNDKKN